MKTTEPTSLYSPGEQAVEAETPGVILRRARLKAGFRKVDIARQLHLSVARIKALEQDQYHQFQSEVFVKGSLRAYGKFLNLDCDALIATYNWFIRANHDVSDLLEPVINIKKPLTQSNHLAGKWVGVFIGIAVLILWFAQPVDRVVKPSPALPAVVESPVEIDIRDRSIIEALGVGAQSPAQDPVVAAVSDIEGNAAADLLSLTFSGDCWVEVRDRDGEIIFASMRHAGDKLELTGRAPFKVLLGYAPVVSMDYNGESVNIDSNARTNSARLVVGST